MRSFWKGVKSMRDNDVLLAAKVGGAVGDANVSKLWQDHFSEQSKAKIELIIIKHCFSYKYTNNYLILIVFRL